MKRFPSLAVVFAALAASSAAHAAYVDLTHLGSFTTRGVLSIEPNLATINFPGNLGGSPLDFFQTAYLESFTISNVTSFEYRLQGAYYRALLSTDNNVPIDLAPTEGEFMTYTFANPTSGYFNISLSAQLTDVTAFSLRNVVGDGPLAAVPAIPEPETYAMLLAGLGLMGAIARRRKQAPAPRATVAA